MVALACLFFARAARAAPDRPGEEAFADGDADAEDFASASPFSPLTGATRRRDVLAAPRGSPWITLGGYRRSTLEHRDEVAAFVVVGVPLDRFARGSTRTSVEPAVERAALGDAPPFELALGVQLARKCVAAAWRAAGLAPDDARLDAIVSRARWSAILPETRLRALRYDDARLWLDPTATDPSRVTSSSGANLALEARLTWRFDRLLYADDEPAFERIRIEHHDARARVAAKVLEALFHWQRAVLDLRTLPPSQLGTRDEADVLLRVMEAEAALDVLTDGTFAANRPRTAPAPSRLVRTKTTGDL